MGQQSNLQPLVADNLPKCYRWLQMWGRKSAVTASAN
jgi:hypothetical protein